MKRQAKQNPDAYVSYIFRVSQTSRTSCTAYSRVLTQRACAREGGQASVELMLALPVMLAVALIVMNASLFISECAAFDRLAPQIVRAQAASVAYGQDIQDSRNLVQEHLEEAFSRDNLEVSVAVEAESGGKLVFSATLKFFPTLFGLGLRSEVLGVELPALSHSVSFTIDQYNPGVIV